LPLLQGQLPAPPGAAFAGASRAPSPPAEQIFFDALIDPSLQTNDPPAQREIPPFFPEHGVLPASA
jgi:hypothetical protein